jgi:hypothetical protein
VVCRVHTLIHTDSYIHAFIHSRILLHFSSFVSYWLTIGGFGLWSYFERVVRITSTAKPEVIKPSLDGNGDAMTTRGLLPLVCLGVRCKNIVAWHRQDPVYVPLQ